jgi:hypothetical protein
MMPRYTSRQVRLKKQPRVRPIRMCIQPAAFWRETRGALGAAPAGSWRSPQACGLNWFFP